MEDLAALLATRASAEGLAVPPELSHRLLAYFELLQRWNRTINLTSLSDPDEAVDRLLLEPVAAARYLASARKIADFGSGGGSPAIPLALALGAPELLMIESRTRKAAFLREAVRVLGLDGRVETARFQDVADRAEYTGGFDVVSIRAVAIDEEVLTSASSLLSPGGVVALFHGPEMPAQPRFPRKDLAWRETRALLRSSESRLSVLFHVEQSE